MLSGKKFHHQKIRRNFAKISKNLFFPAAKLCTALLNPKVKVRRTFRNFKQHGCFNISAIVTGCSPSCGPNASCLEIGGRPVCECNPGFEGDGYVCAGKLCNVACSQCYNELDQ